MRGLVELGTWKRDPIDPGNILITEETNNNNATRHPPPPDTPSCPIQRPLNVCFPPSFTCKLTPAV